MTGGWKPAATTACRYFTRTRRKRLELPAGTSFVSQSPVPEFVRIGVQSTSSRASLYWTSYVTPSRVGKANVNRPSTTPSVRISGGDGFAKVRTGAGVG